MSDLTSDSTSADPTTGGPPASEDATGDAEASGRNPAVAKFIAGPASLRNTQGPSSVSLARPPEQVLLDVVVGQLDPKAIPPLPPPILETRMANQVPGFTSDPNWASVQTGGRTFLDHDTPVWQWQPVLHPADETFEEITAVSGTVVEQDDSDDDIPFTHPFGFDWEFMIAPDPGYQDLLSDGNRNPTDPAYVRAKQTANTHISPGVPGVIGVEVDGPLVPAAFRVHPGERVAVFGRWIVDTGHNDFHTEIHPPLALARAAAAPKPGDPDQPPGPLVVTESTLLGPPCLVSQNFENDNAALRTHFFNEVEKVEEFQSLQLEAIPLLLTKPFTGPILFTYLVRPPVPRPSPGARLQATFHFTVRTGIAVQLASGPDDSVMVFVVFGGNYRPPPAPQRAEFSMSLDELKQLNPAVADAFDKIFFVNIVFHPLAQAILNRGVKIVRLAAPQPPDTRTITPHRITLDELPIPDSFLIDDNQPFPITGFLNVEWLPEIPNIAATRDTPKTA
jgi:hypothetical protein